MPHRLADLIMAIFVTVIRLLGINSLAELIAWTMTIGAAIWLIKTVFRIGSKRKARRDDYWLNRAQARQEVRFRNAMPPLAEEAQPLKKTRKERRNERKGLSPTGWKFNEQTQMWEHPSTKKAKEKIWSPSGWYFDEKKGEWVAPDYIKAEANTRWEWDDKKRIWIDKSKKKRR